MYFFKPILKKKEPVTPLQQLNDDFFTSNGAKFFLIQNDNPSMPTEPSCVFSAFPNYVPK